MQRLTDNELKNLLRDKGWCNVELDEKLADMLQDVYECGYKQAIKDGINQDMFDYELIDKIAVLLIERNRYGK